MFSTRLITADIETFMNLSSSSNWISMWLNFVYQISLFSIISLIYVYIHLYFCDVVLMHIRKVYEVSCQNLSHPKSICATISNTYCDTLKWNFVYLRKLKYHVCKNLLRVKELKLWNKSKLFTTPGLSTWTETDSN